MKKVLFTVALMFGAMVASAQVSVVKEAKSMKKDPVAAAKVLEAALTNPETANDPETWKLAGDLQKAIYDDENMKMYLPGGQADMPKMYGALIKMFEYYLKCDEVEQAGVANGTVKKAKHRKKNSEVLLSVRGNLANGGVEAFNENNYEAAQKYFGLFVDVVENPMFADQAAALKADTLNSLYANYATMAAGLREPKDVASVIKYGNVGKESNSEGWRALMFMAEVYGKEQVDSVKWLETIKEGAQRFPEQDFFVGNIMDYYLQRNMVDDALSMIDGLLASNEKPYFWYVKGVLLYEKKDYDAANVALDKVIAMNQGDTPETSLVAEAYAKKGDIYFFPAQKIVEENSTLNIDDPKYNANEAKIKEAYELAKPFYEKAKELEPDNKTIWGQQLLRVYWALNKAEYEALEKEMGY
jgi:tetratricopeptide (TPR) repeat protein